ncbi:MAG: hypothetical protein AAF943_00280 [Pseudomonadota bacterium]
MREQELEYHIRVLRRRFEMSDDATRAQMRPSIEQMVGKLRARGRAVPPSLKQLERFVHDAETEDFFENLPI